MVEWNHDACETIRENQRRWVRPAVSWPLFEMDVRQFDYSDYSGGRIDLLAGGPPCQPFSLAGKHRGHDDVRDMFPEVVRAVREVKPRAVLIENVKGLQRGAFADYFEYIVLQLNHPELARRDGDTWVDHRARLEEYHTQGRYDGLTYNVVFQMLNAADFGVPQRRERVFIVAFRSDLGVEWSFPTATHSVDALLRDQWVTGDYWDRHRVAVSDRPSMPARVTARVEQIRHQVLPVEFKPWVTVRDAIRDLPDPRSEKGTTPILNHRYMPGARSYPGHTGSPLDEPAKTLKAGDHGVPGGENTLAYPDGSVRYFTVRESARLQSFPDEFAFAGSWTESMRQIGNAVPVALANAVAGKVHSSLQGKTAH